ncbi:hypothetical protein V8J38_11245 [Brevundimonas olei]|uniref:Uncharacterized protein n=1 Tax=Brevundimonas olei TaxID=657642 RepID=A0ABZ2IBZ2_9CAUL
MTWLFRTGGSLLALFGVFNIMLAGYAVATSHEVTDGPAVLILLVGGMLALVFGALHAVAKTTFSRADG